MSGRFLVAHSPVLQIVSGILPGVLSARVAETAATINVAVERV